MAGRAQSHRILAFHYLGAVELAIYSFAIAPPEQIKGVFKFLGTLALPKFSKRLGSALVSMKTGIELILL